MINQRLLEHICSSRFSLATEVESLAIGDSVKEMVMEGFPYVGISEAAKLTGFTAGYIRRLISEDQIDAYKLSEKSTFLFLDSKAI